VPDTDQTLQIHTREPSLPSLPKGTVSDIFPDDAMADIIGSRWEDHHMGHKPRVPPLVHGIPGSRDRERRVPHIANNRETNGNWELVDRDIQETNEANVPKLLQMGLAGTPLKSNESMAVPLPSTVLALVSLCDIGVACAVV
jgi:hypothetical protein